MERNWTFATWIFVARCPALAEPGCFDKDRLRDLLWWLDDDLGCRSSPVRSVVIPGVAKDGLLPGENGGYQDLRMSIKWQFQREKN